MSTMQTVIEKLAQEHNLPDGELLKLITSTEADTNQLLAAAADKIRQQYYGKKVYIRCLIEFTNYCKNNCYYCGIRAGNSHAQRYRLSKEQILDCCAEGYKLGFRTFVLQGGEDPYFTDERICEIVAAIRQQHPDCAITLSIGEKEKASYQAYFEAGANRYLLRHETADAEHYAKLHPASMSLANRKRCLFDQGDWLSGGQRLYGGLTLPNAAELTSGPALFAGATARYDWHRPLYHARANALCRAKKRHGGANAAPFIDAAADVPLCTAAINHCARHHPSQRTRAGAKGWRQRGHA